jgi:hypothetical protein
VIPGAIGQLLSYIGRRKKAFTDGLTSNTARYLVLVPI